MTNPFANHQKELQQLIDEYGITYLALFGSRARGDHKPDSDYDLLYDYNKRLSLLDASGFQLGLRKLLDSEVNIVSNKYLKPRFRETIKDDLITLYEK